MAEKAVLWMYCGGNTLREAQKKLGLPHDKLIIETLCTELINKKVDHNSKSFGNLKAKDAVN